MPTCILMEKLSAFKNMIQALHGTKVNNMEGKAHFNGHDYLITHSVGCIREYVDPTKMLKNPKLKSNYVSWNVDAPLWNPNDFNWRQKEIPGTGNILKGIKNVANQCNAFIIAGDTDDSGMGDQIQVDILRAIHWNWKQNPVYRIRFDDDNVHSDLRKALRNGITPMINKANMGLYHQSVGRGHWDYLSMQETRKATSYARNNGYNVRVVNEGRLKSVVMLQIWKKWQARKNYVKKPYWETQFKDENGHVYSRKASYKSHPDFRFTDKSKAQTDLGKYHNSKPANIKTQKKTQAPGKLLNLSSLSAILNGYGYSPAQIQATYQKMYESGIVSYPRTDDKAITLAQWKQFEPIANKVAKTVGINPKLLNYRKPRKKILTKHADHGANRIMKAVSLSSLKKFGSCGQAIYKTLAKNDLAQFAPDYVYKRTTAQLADYPKFKTSFSTPVKMNWKLVFNPYADEKKKDNHSALGKVDKPFLHSGTNPKPGKPTTRWLSNMLGKYNVGTGATRLSVNVELTTGKSKRMSIKHRVIRLNNDGIICAEMAQGTMIGDVKTTAQLFALMNQVKTGKIHISDIERTATLVVKHDKPIFAKNAQHLTAPKSQNQYETFPVTVDGKVQNVNRKFMSHRFSDSEVSQLKNGKTIEIGPLKSKNRRFDIKGKLDWNVFKKHKFYGFKVVKFIPKSNKEKFPVTVDGKVQNVNRKFMNHRFSDNEVNDLKDGKTIEIGPFKSKGAEFNVKGKLDWNKFKGHKFYGFKLVKFIPKNQREKVTVNFNGKSVQFNRTFAQHRFTNSEIQQLAQGKKIIVNIKTKAGKTMKVQGELAQQSFNGNKFYGFKLLKIIPSAKMKKQIAQRAARPHATIQGKKGQFNPQFAGHKFSDEELTQLEAGSTLRNMKFKSKKGKTFTANVKLHWNTFRGHKFLGYKMSFK